MKKYVKPLMENETFVVNEYVGVCSIMTCGSCEESQVYNKVTPEQVIDQLGLSSISTTDYYKFSGTINGKSAESCIKETITTEGKKPNWIEGISPSNHWLSPFYWIEEAVWDWYKGEYGDGSTTTTNYYHAVQVSLKGTSDGPNAS